MRDGGWRWRGHRLAKDKRRSAGSRQRVTLLGERRVAEGAWRTFSGGEGSHLAARSGRRSKSESGRCWRWRGVRYGGRCWWMCTAELEEASGSEQRCGGSGWLRGRLCGGRRRGDRCSSVKQGARSKRRRAGGGGCHAAKRESCRHRRTRGRRRRRRSAKRRQRHTKRCRGCAEERGRRCGCGSRSGRERGSWRGRWRAKRRRGHAKERRRGRGRWRGRAEAEDRRCRRWCRRGSWRRRRLGQACGSQRRAIGRRALLGEGEDERAARRRLAQRRRSARALTRCKGKAAR
mmetsp:Transcript_17771/g.40717  ORF Transcript_17771/g.40717 Transcript_17771/m.40717 type:complete len:290 (+) Transcript_17771:1456-2325(+)